MSSKTEALLATLEAFVRHQGDKQPSPNTRRRTNEALVSALRAFDSTLAEHNDVKALVHVVANNLTVSNAQSLVAVVRRVLSIVCPKVSARTAAFSQLRRAVQDRQPADWSKLRFIVCRSEADRLASERAQTAALARKQADRITLPYTDIQQAVQVLTTCDDVASLVALAQLCSAARLIEILQVSEFLPLPEPDLILIRGVAKNDDVDCLVRRLLFLSRDAFLDLMRQIRRHVQEAPESARQSNVLLSAHFNKCVNTVVARHFPGMTSHDLRRISVNLSYALYQKGETKNFWIQHTLGHRHLATSLHYNALEVVDVDQTCVRPLGLPAQASEVLPNEAPVEPPLDIPEHAIPQESVVTADKVELRDELGGVHTFERNQRSGSGTAADRCQHIIDSLLSKRIPASKRNLGKLGFGASTVHKARKRRRPRPVPGETVSIRDGRNEWQEVTKLPRVRGPAKTLQRFQDVAQQLVRRQIPLTQRNFRKVGVGDRTFSLYKHTLRGDRGAAGSATRV